MAGYTNAACDGFPWEIFLLDVPVVTNFVKVVSVVQHCGTPDQNTGLREALIIGLPSTFE